MDIGAISARRLAVMLDEANDRDFAAIDDTAG